MSESHFAVKRHTQQVHSRCLIDLIRVNWHDVRVLEPREQLGFARAVSCHFQRDGPIGELALLGPEDAGERPFPSSSTRWNPPMVCPASGK